MVSDDPGDMKNIQGVDCKEFVTKDNSELDSQIFVGVRQLVIVAGVAGGFSSRASVSVAESAAKMGVESILVVAIMPFDFQGQPALERATSTAERLSEIKGVEVMEFNNEALVTECPDLNFFNAFEVADKEIMKFLESELNLFTREARS